MTLFIISMVLYAVALVLLISAVVTMIRDTEASPVARWVAGWVFWLAGAVLTGINIGL